jgi:hypothetical protein
MRPSIRAKKQVARDLLGSSSHQGSLIFTVSIANNSNNKIVKDLYLEKLNLKVELLP